MFGKIEAMKDRLLITSFFTANLADIAITTYGMTQKGFMERGVSANAFFETQNPVPMYIAKLAITAGLIGLYALSKKSKNVFGVKWEYVFEKALQFGNVAVWTMMLWNGINVGAYLLDKLR
jgi:hypothetical protein